MLQYDSEVENDANAGNFACSRNRIYWEMSFLGDGISLCLYSVVSKYEEAWPWHKKVVLYLY